MTTLRKLILALIVCLPIAYVGVGVCRHFDHVAESHKRLLEENKLLRNDAVTLHVECLRLEAIIVNLSREGHQ